MTTSIVRPSELSTLLGVAELWARRSTCSYAQVGAVIERDGRPLATGYNGAPSGMPHCSHGDPYIVDRAPCATAVHAEANAIAFAARHGVATAGATMICTLSPCVRCAHLVIQAGITGFVYRTSYRDPAGLDMLRAGGVAVQAATP